MKILNVIRKGGNQAPPAQPPAPKVEPPRTPSSPEVANMQAAFQQFARAPTIPDDPALSVLKRELDAAIASLGAGCTGCAKAGIYRQFFPRFVACVSKK